MALIKYKPRTPGTRAVVKVDRSHLYKGGPLESLTAHQSKTIICATRLIQSQPLCQRVPNCTAFVHRFLGV